MYRRFPRVSRRRANNPLICVPITGHNSLLSIFLGRMSVRANEENVHTVTVNNTRCINEVPRVNNTVAMLCFTYKK